MDSKVGCLPGSQVLSAGSNSSQSYVVGGNVSAARRAVEARTVKVWLVMGRQALEALRWASSSKKMYSGMSGASLVVLAHLNGEQYHVQCL